MADSPHKGIQDHDPLMAALINPPKAEGIYKILGVPIKKTPESYSLKSYLLEAVFNPTSFAQQVDVKPSSDTVILHTDNEALADSSNKIDGWLESALEKIGQNIDSTILSLVPKTKLEEALFDLLINKNPTTPMGLSPMEATLLSRVFELFEERNKLQEERDMLLHDVEVLLGVKNDAVG